MELIFNNPISGPQTHVLIIGVSEYPYLHQQQHFISGDNPKRPFKELGQLTTSFHSAVSLYSTIKELHQNGSWATPLGSIDLLLTHPQGKPFFVDGYICTPPTISNIKFAYDRWKKRCNQDPGNVAIFYFCGHGLEKDEQYLLANDFMADPARCSEQAFNIDKTIRAFKSCQARTKLFFVDACRITTQEIVHMDFAPQALEMNHFFGADPADYLIQKAAAHNASAYGRPGEPSFYTSALINALKGAVADTNEDGDWYVNTSDIAKNINQLMAALAPSQGYDQRCISSASTGTNILKLPQTPNVPIYINCSPEEAIFHAELSCHDPYTNSLLQKNRSPSADDWILQMTAGPYRFSADFSTNDYKSDSRIIWAKPPNSHCRLNCR